jgi:hypothetical protein
MGIKAEIIQNEVTCNTNFELQVKLYSDADDSAYVPGSATVTYLLQDGTALLEDQSMTIVSNLISHTLSSSYIENPTLYNSAVITIVQSDVTQTLTFIFHVVKQIIPNPLKLQDIYDQYEIIEKHEPSKRYEKINAAFLEVKDDLRDKYSMQYSLGIIDATQIKKLVLLKAVELISRDMAAGKGMSDDNYWYGLYRDTQKEYVGKLDSTRFAFDADVEDSTVDSIRATSHINCYR